MKRLLLPLMVVLSLCAVPAQAFAEIVTDGPHPLNATTWLANGTMKLVSNHTQPSHADITVTVNLTGQVAQWNGRIQAKGCVDHIINGFVKRYCTPWSSSTATYKIGLNPTVTWKTGISANGTDPLDWVQIQFDDVTHGLNALGTGITTFGYP